MEQHVELEQSGGEKAASENLHVAREEGYRHEQAGDYRHDPASEGVGEERAAKGEEYKRDPGCDEHHRHVAEVGYHEAAEGEHDAGGDCAQAGNSHVSQENVGEYGGEPVVGYEVPF